MRSGGALRSAAASILRVLWLASFAAAAAAHAAGIEVVDDRGVAIHWPAPPQRVVSLLPSLTETVCALGRCALLVGVDDYSGWPASVRGLPRLGGGLDPNVEAVLALRPDAVLMARSSPFVQRLEALGLKVVAIEPRTHADIERELLAVARIVGAPPAKAAAVWSEVNRQVEAAARSVTARARGARVYFEVDSTPYAAAPSSFIGETLSRLGAGNIVPAGLGPFPKLNPEFVVRADPDVIIATGTGRPAFAGRPGWSGLRAVRGGRICAFAPAEMELIERPGPRLGEGAALLARCLNQAAGAP